MSDYNTNNFPKTIEEVETYAQKMGITLAPKDYADMQAVMSERQKNLELEVIKVESISRGRLAAFVDQFNRIYPRFLKTLLGIGDVLITGTQTVVIAFGVPILLVMLMIVEQQRVYHGMTLFEAVTPLASFGAWVLVLANIVFELLISWKENRAGYIEPPRTEFSLRILSQRISYMSGRLTDWTPRQKSPALRFKVVLRIVTFTILILALAGSMRSIIEATQGNWLTALRSIIFESSLSQMITWLGGLLFALAAVLSAQALSQYVSQKVIEVVSVMQSTIEDKSEVALKAVGLTGAAFMMARIKERQRERRLATSVSAQRMSPVSGVFPLVSGTVETSETSTETRQISSLVSRKLSPAVKDAVSWLDRNSETIEDMTVRQIAEMAGMSLSTMQRAITYRRENAD